MAIEHKDIAAIREDYSKGILSENDIDKNPFSQFKNWFQQALNAEVLEPNAMVLSTVDADGFPSSRVVLMKDIKENGISFFTNYESQKSIDIERDNKVSILFFWPELQRQVRMDAKAQRVEESDSTEYFQSRPKGSQIGAWASPQSQIIPHREYLEDRVASYKEQYNDVDLIPRPDHWGGFLIVPIKFEFWQGRSSRLHDRIQYVLEDNQWVLNRLAP